MVVDIIEIKEKEIVTAHIATTNDILLEINTFFVRISRSVKKVYEAGKRGRKKGERIALKHLLNVRNDKNREIKEREKGTKKTV